MINASPILILEVYELPELISSHLIDPFGDLSVDQAPVHKGAALVRPQLALHQFEYLISGASRYDHEGMPLYLGRGSAPHFFRNDAEGLRADQAQCPRDLAQVRHGHVRRLHGQEEGGQVKKQLRHSVDLLVVETHCQEGPVEEDVRVPLYEMLILAHRQLVLTIRILLGVFDQVL